jgi:uncharacterized protein YndB with AHSA1/START domain
MTTQKTFKRRVRARAAKTGESYTTARSQLLHRTDAAPEPDRAGPPTPAPIDTLALSGVSEEAMLSRTGRSLAEWFAMLDAWGAADRTHTEIARWLRDVNGVDGWWSQTVTVGYERAKGRRVLHQTAAGFSVGVTRTVAASEDAVRAMFADPARRALWLAGGPMAANGGYRGPRGRYDWTDPPSKVWVDLVPKAGGKTSVTVTHEGLPGADAAAAMKQSWRAALDRLKAVLAAG